MTVYSLDVLFPIWNQSIVPCPVLTVASWPAYRFLRIQVRWSGIPISFHILFLENFQNFPQFLVIHTVKGSGIVNKTEIDVFLGLSCFSMVQWMLAVWSLVPLPFLNPACTSGSSQFMFCWSLAEPPQINCHCFHCFSIYLPWSDGTRCQDLSFLIVEF